MAHRNRRKNKQSGEAKEEKKPAEFYQNLKPSELLDEFKNDSEVKIVSRKVPFENSFELVDVSLHGKGQDEDKLYAFDEFYRDNIRRGNTYLNITYPDKTFATLIARKGLKKFFDLYLEYLENKMEGKFGIKDVDEHLALKDIIFYDVEEAFKKGMNVKVYKLVKANGENCQVSFSKESQAWIIASKNVGLLARTAEDLKFYEKEQRYSFAYLIGLEWFRILDELNKQGTDMKLMQKDFTSFTLVGEYCGNQDYQHLVKYNKIDLHFYAIVDNLDPQNTCIPVDEAYKYFKMYKLSTVNYEVLGDYSSFDTLKNGLKQAYVKVSESDIESDQEGSVLYFVSHIKDGDQKVLSLCKLKTLEYRVYRKLREKLKTYISRLDNKNSKSARDVIKKFENEVKDLCSGYNLPREFDYYFTVADYAFAFVDNYPEKATLIHDEYITFLSIVLNCVENNRKITPFMWGKDYLEKIKKIPWSTYKYKLRLKDEKSSESKPPAMKKEKSQEGGNKLFVLIPLTIPGIGKSYYTRFLKEAVKGDPDMDYYEVSSDKVRREAMDVHMRNNKNCTLDIAFEKTGKQAGLDFFRKIEAILKEIQNSSKRTIVFFLDKNHPPNAIPKVIETFKGYSLKNRELKILAVVPKSLQPFKYQKGTIPFSLNTIMNCIMRVLVRENHETLNGTPEKNVGVLSMFLGFFKGVNFSDKTIVQNGFDGKIELPFVYEDLQSDSKYPENIVDTLEKVVTKTNSGSMCGDEELIKTFTKMLKEYKHEFVYPKPEDCIKAFLDGLKNASYSEKRAESGPKAAEKAKKEEEERKADEPAKERKPISFIGLFVKDDKKAQEVLAEKLNEMLKAVNTTFKQELKIDELKFPDTLHITSLFLGGKEDREKTPYFTSFKENVELNLEIEAFAFTPGLVCGVCLPEKEELQVENRFPHMTTKTCKPLMPKNSNDVLTALFKEGQPLENKYKKEFFRENKGKCMEFEVEVENVGSKEKRKVYLWILEEPLAFAAATRIIYFSKH